ncbi:hypothetical protein BpHYR1_012475 [Brachionus plicatilis]|uniref:MULE transposase domain-containing protein n=1 Tax=Brachionus plicatilis TaxID=10195 RepID=A0A3M7PKE9_BRAPC|nr:hypothetical protein BpHYR1_012475 [Brachionus plicatilis]
MHNFKQQIDRKRKKETDFCKEAKTLKELVIQEKNKLTKSGKDFILFDSGCEDEERILIVSTRENIEFLNSESVWYVDGTFEISPDIFKQLFTINVIKNNRNLPLVYCFLPNKQQKTYIKLFNNLKSKGISVIPVYIFSDFELAIMNSIRECFPGAQIGGCYFHLTSNLWKHVTNGLRKDHKNDKNFKIYFRYLKLIPLVPLKHTIFVFNELRERVKENSKKTNRLLI